MQKTKMIVTIGPSIKDKNKLKRLIKEGMNVARINFYHHSYDEIEKLVSSIRELDEELNTSTAILGDIRDCKIRTNEFINGSAFLKSGDEFSFLCGSEILGDNTRCSITTSYLHENLHIGDKVYIENGLMSFKVTEIIGREIKCTVIDGGIISAYKQLNIPNFKHPSSIYKRIENDIEFACNISLDFISASCVENGTDALEYRDKILEYGNNKTKLMCEIENSESVTNIDSILDGCYGVIISRGELGIDMPVERIPFIQKEIIKKCNIRNKVSIVSTQVLSSMAYFPRPTRAESSDVFNAALDGADAIMLTRTTSIGNYPLETLTTLRKILCDSENHMNFAKYIKPFSNNISDYDNLMASSVAEISNKFPIKAIIIGTVDGRLPKYISKYRPKAPIIAVTNNKNVARSFGLEFGVTPFVYTDFESKKTFMEEARNLALNKGFAKKYDTILVLTADKTFSWKSDTLEIVNI